MTVNNFVIVGFIVTWAIALLGFGVHWGTTRAEIREIREWIKGHETYSREHDKEMVFLRETIAKMDTAISISISVKAAIELIGCRAGFMDQFDELMITVLRRTE